MAHNWGDGLHRQQGAAIASSPAQRLREMAEELRQLAVQAEAASSGEEGGTLMFRLPKASGPQDVAVFAQAIYEQRRRRAEIFSQDLFAEPAWDLLLDLFVAKRRNVTVSVTSACIAANVPPTTALRWIAILEAEGLVERKADEADGRRILLALTQDGEARMKRYFTQIMHCNAG